MLATEHRQITALWAFTAYVSSRLDEAPEASPGAILEEVVALATATLADIGEPPQGPREAVVEL